MLHSDRVVFVELHKSGSTRVAKLLAEVAGPDLGDKQPTYANALAGLGKPVVGYVCDPLHWYLALWKHGCAGKGDLRKRLTDPAKWAALMAKRAARAQDAGKQPPGREIPEGWGAEHARTAWYGNPESPQAFREWLKAVLMTRGIRRLVNNAYNNSPVQKIAGLMTYEYFATFVRDTEAMEKWVDSPEALVALHAKKAITHHVVRAESPGADLIQVLAEIGLPLTDEQAATARAWDEGNARQKQKQIDTFYDTETRHWVQRREKAMFKILGYSLPLAEDNAAEPQASAGPAPSQTSGEAVPSDSSPPPAPGEPAPAAPPARAKKAAKADKAKAAQPEKAKALQPDKSPKTDPAGPSPAEAGQAEAPPRAGKASKAAGASARSGSSGKKSRPAKEGSSVASGKRAKTGGKAGQAARGPSEADDVLPGGAAPDEVTG